MKGKRNLFKIILFASTFLIATNPSNIYSSPADDYKMQEKARKAKWNLWRKYGNAKLKFTGVNVDSTVNFALQTTKVLKQLFTTAKIKKIDGKI